MNGGFNPPPVPDNSPILAAASHEAGPPEAEARGRAPRDLVSELRSDPYLCTTFRNACIKQEEIIKQVSDLALANQIPINDPQDIRRGVETYLTNLMYEEPRSRNAKLARILRDLTTRGSTSRHYTAILKEISALNGWWCIMLEGAKSIDSGAATNNYITLLYRDSQSWLKSVLTYFKSQTMYQNSHVFFGW